ncbi:hypothetical protein ACLGI4_20725 [Streptomyces sp. HMX112]|uniref:hypothetical protein n=1 Tax=Streptomyces sp. HMX112 TaxID=3390850 RepID=UPI003A7FD2F3
MNARTRRTGTSRPYRTPECRLEECELCSGPTEVRVPHQAAWEAPVLVLPCACRCHRVVAR